MNRLPLALATVAVVVLAVLSPAASAQAATVVITGTVTLDGIPVAHTEVGWFDPTTRTAGETRTNAAGGYGLSVGDGHPFVLYAGVNYSADGDSTHEKGATWTSLGGTTFVPKFQGPGGSDYLYQNLALYAASRGPIVSNIDLDKPGSITATAKVMAGLQVEATTVYGVRVGGGTANAAGTVTIRGLIPGSYRVAVPSLSTVEPFQSQIVTVAQGATTRVRAEFDEQKGSISGVVTSGGKPVKHVSVAAFGAGIGAGDETDARGRYTIASLPRGEYEVTVNAGQEGYFANNRYTQVVKTTTVATDKRTTLDARLAVGGTLTASVLATTGAGKLNVALSTAKGVIVGGSNFDPKNGKATTVKLSGIKPGTYTALFTDTEQKFYAKRTVTIGGGRTTVLGGLSLSQKTITLTGSIAGGVRATISYSSTGYYQSLNSTDRSGRYTLRGLVPGFSGTLVVQSTGRVNRSYPITVTAATAKKNVSAGARYGTLQAVYTAGGYPLRVGSVGVTLKGDFSTALSITKGVATGSAAPGKATLELVPDEASAYLFVTNSPFWVSIPKAESTATVRSGKTTDLGTVALRINR